MAGFENQVMVAKNVNFDHLSNPPHNGIVTADGQLLIGSTADPNIAIVANTLTAGTGITITNGPGSITIASTASSTDLHTANYIVSSAGTSGTGANYTTITDAIAAAQGSGIPSTIFIQPGTNGTYTENFTLPANINLVAYTADAFTPTVTIIGKITCTDAGTRSISGIRLQTNSDFFLAVTGSAASIVNLNNCYFNCSNNTGISYTSSGASSAVNTLNCQGNLGTTGIGLFSMSSAGTLSILYTLIENSGASTTANTASAGTLFMRYSRFANPLTTSGTNVISAMTFSIINTAAQNATSFTAGGTSAAVNTCNFISGTASAISVSTSLEIRQSDINSSNTNAITGAGTITFSGLTFNNSFAINTTTQAASYFRPAILVSSQQPAFLAYLNTTVTNVTGDLTEYTIIFDTEVYDQGNNFNLGTSTFTAPVTGKYMFNLVVSVIGGTAINQGNIKIATSNRSYQLGIASGIGGTTTANGIISILADMDAADTATFTVTTNDTGGKIDDIQGLVGGILRTFVSGHLVC